MNFAIKFGASFVLGVVDPAAEHAVGNGMLLTLGSGLLLEGLVVLLKASRIGGRIVWERGKDGQPHKTSPFLDRIQQKMQGTGWSQPDQREHNSFRTLLDDVKNLDFRQPNSTNTEVYSSQRTGSAGAGSAVSGTYGSPSQDHEDDNDRR